MAIERITLPKRVRESNRPKFPDEMLDEVNGLLDDTPDGEALVIARQDSDGKPFDAESKARAYARNFAEDYQEAFADGDDAPRLLSTHAVVTDYFKSGDRKGKAKEWVAAVSRNTRKPIAKRPDGAPTLRALVSVVREYKRTHPREDRTFANYTQWSYDELRAAVNEHTDFNDGRPTVSDDDQDQGQDQEQDQDRQPETANV